MTPELPADHPQRRALAGEVHARPPEPLVTPMRASHLALVLGDDERAAEREHLARLCTEFGVAPPADGITHLSIALGALRLKWERHGEFSGYTVYAAGVGAGFDDPPSAQLPPEWLRAIPGRTLVAAEGLLLAATEAPDPGWLAGHFGPEMVIGAQVADGAGLAFSDFRIDAGGRSRFVLVDRGLTQRQAGRVMQRLFEIEAYRMLAMLALPLARTLGPRLREGEAALARLTAGIAQDDGREEVLLHDLTRLAADVERELSTHQYRFGACRAYAELVHTRVAELREQRLPGLQTIEEFMQRRFSPAVATCATVSQRLHDLSERVAQASALLATRVGIARERQNQALLASMDRRAKQQLHLQQTVEGLSVAAIAYYAAGLVGYIAKGAKAGGLKIDSDLVVGLAVPVLAGLVFLAVRRARRSLHDDGHEAAPDR